LRFQQVIDDGAAKLAGGTSDEEDFGHGRFLNCADRRMVLVVSKRDQH